MRHPLVIIGLDGAGFNVLDPLFAQGHLPHLRRLAEEGMRTELLSTLPVATLPAWTSFLTAAHPAEHGVTDIFVRGAGYGLQPATGQLRTLPTFLSRLSAAGLSVAALGVPGTFPPEAINGVCVAGFDAPGARQARPEAVWPPAFYATLQQWGGWRYATFNEHAHAGAAARRAVQALLVDIEAKERMILNTYAQRPWDVFFVHLQASDTAAHHLWHTFDAASPRADPAADAVTRDALPSVYRRLDTLIGRLRLAAPNNARFLVVSDHGMGGAATCAVYLNRWLHEQGLLQFAPSATRPLRRAAGAVLRQTLARLPPGALGLALRKCPPKWLGPLMNSARGAAINHGASAAFSDELDYAPAIWLNRVGAFPQGTVTDAQAPALLERLQAALLALRAPHDDSPLIRRVHRRDQLPGGEHSGRMPDLLIEPAWPGGYRPSFLTSPGPGPAVRRLEPREFAAPKGAGMPGVHRREGVFIAAGPGLPAMEVPALHIHQAGALVYPLVEAALPAAAAEHIPRYLLDILQAPRAGRAPDAPTPTTVDAYDPAHSLELTRRLEALGYL